MKRAWVFTIIFVFSVFLETTSVWGAEVCVDSASALQSALTTAAGNNEDDTIMVVQGTYTRTGGFSLYSGETLQNITLLGGYTSGCGDRDIDPALTILDSNNSGSVLDIYHPRGGDIIVEGFTLQNGSSSSSGGGIRAYIYSSSSTSGDIEIIQNVITGNSAASTYQGGGIWASSKSDSSSPAGDIKINNNTVTGNTSDYDGGGVYALSYSTGGVGGEVILVGNIISGNTSTTYSGGVCAISQSDSNVAGPVTMVENIITNNIGSDNGGGVYVETLTTGGGGTISLTANTVTSNTTSGSYSNGGGIFAFARCGTTLGTSGNIILTNNIVAGNTSSGATCYGGGVWADSSSFAGPEGEVTLTNNTITGNTVGNIGGGVSLDGSSVKCYNNIIWGNSAATSDGDIYIYIGATAYGYNNDYSSFSGTWNGGSGENINVDPLFLDAGASDYHLSTNSPCINMGFNTAPEIPEHDFEGDLRINHRTVDMGADEFIRAIVSQFLLLLLN